MPIPMLMSAARKSFHVWKSFKPNLSDRQHKTPTPLRLQIAMVSVAEVAYVARRPGSFGMPMATSGRFSLSRSFSQSVCHSSAAQTWWGQFSANVVAAASAM